MGLACSRHLVMETLAVAVDLTFYRAINRDVNRREKQFRGAIGLIVTGPRARNYARRPADSASRTLRPVTTTFASMRQPRLPAKVVEDDAAICRSIIRFEYVARNEATVHN